MADLKSPMDIWKLLDQSNCKKCEKPTCLAFAAAVFKGEKQLHECPGLSADIIERYEGAFAEQEPFVQVSGELVRALKKRIGVLDLSSAAQRLGAEFVDGKLTIKCLGKAVRVDSKGDITTDIHIHPWITVPVFNYVLEGAGVPVSGRWVPFRELPGGATWYRLFEQRCEKPLKRVADTYTALFEDMVRLFKGKQVQNHYASDISLVLHPLPKVPILICYWKPEDNLESNLNIFFDSTAEQNLNIESIFTLATGLVLMFEKLSRRHGN